jgi:membrane associated rhomboid family serine protease
MIILSDSPETSKFPVVNWLLILFNVSAFCYSLTLIANPEYAHIGLVPAQFLKNHDGPQLAMLLISMFTHAGLLHLFGNMWALYLFGDNVEDKLGHFPYLAFYLACGIFAGLLHVFVNPDSILPCVGASGAIAGVMGAYVVFYPNATCKTWWGDDLFFFAFKTYDIPATFVIGGWFLFQIILSTTVPLTGGGVAFHAHIGGFVAGMILAFLLTRGAAAPDGETPNSRLEFFSNPRIIVVMGICIAGLLITLFRGPAHVSAASLPAVVKPSRVVQTKHTVAPQKPAKPSQPVVSHHPVQSHHNTHKHASKTPPARNSTPSNPKPKTP